MSSAAPSRPRVRRRRTARWSASARRTHRPSCGGWARAASSPRSATATSGSRRTPTTPSRTSTASSKGSSRTAACSRSPATSALAFAGSNILYNSLTMLLREVGYARLASLAEAIELLAANDGARALAGGQTLINVMKARAGSPDALIDLGRIAELRGIELGADGTLEIGAMTTYTDIADSSEARARPILGEVCAQIADVQVRNRGTIGGNICTNDPTNHLPPLLAALGAEMTIAGRDGARTVSAPEFFLGVYMTAVGQGEVLTKIRVPAGRGDGFAAVTLGVEGTCIVSA